MGIHSQETLESLLSLQSTYPSMVPTTFGAFGDGDQNRKMDQRSANLSPVHDKGGTSFAQVHDKSGYERFTNQVGFHHWVEIQMVLLVKSYVLD